MRRGVLNPAGPVREHRRTEGDRRRLTETGTWRSAAEICARCEVGPVPTAEERLKSTLSRPPRFTSLPASEPRRDAGVIFAPRGS